MTTRPPNDAGNDGLGRSQWSVPSPGENFARSSGRKTLRVARLVCDQFDPLAWRMPVGHGGSHDEAAGGALASDSAEDVCRRPWAQGGGGVGPHRCSSHCLPLAAKVRRPQRAYAEACSFPS